MRRMHTPPWWYVLLASFVSSLLTGVLSLVLAVHYAQETGRKFCDVLIAQDSPESPPTTERGKVIAEKIRELRRSLDCDG
jgi:hypothetical protein